MPQLTYTIDATHSSVHFSIRHLMVSNARGEFSKLSGTIRVDTDHLDASSVDASIDVASINTRDADRDAHLKGADFLDVEKFPTITFKSKKVTPHEGGATVVGDLTIHGETVPVTLDVEGTPTEIKDPWGNQRIGMTATTKISRKEFGLTWNAALEAGGVMIGDEVKVTIDLQAVGS